MRAIAFLKGINVGGHRVTMARLAEIFVEQGLLGVETFIASGNVLFDSPAEPVGQLEQRLEAALEAQLGYAVATFIRSPAEVATLAELVPLAPETRNRVAEGTWSPYVGFLHKPPPAAAASALKDLSGDDDELQLHGRELWWLRRGRISDSKVTGPKLERALGRVDLTLRNITTIRRLAAK